MGWWCWWWCATAAEATETALQKKKKQKQKPLLRLHCPQSVCGTQPDDGGTSATGTSPAGSKENFKKSGVCSP